MTTDLAGASPVDQPVRRHFVNDWGVTVYAYQTARGGVYHQESAALSVADDEAVHALVRFVDVANDVADGRKMNDVRQAIRDYYAALQAGKDARAARDVAFLTIEEALGMTPNARVNRRLPAKLVDVLLNNKLGRCAKARCHLQM